MNAFTNTCKVCGSPRAYYRVGTSPHYGPRASWADGSRGIYCFEHAVERAADLMPAWKERRKALREASAAAHAAWYVQFQARTQEAQK